MIRSWLVLSVALVLATASVGCEKLKARDNLNKGVQSYKNAQYPQAVEYFEKAVQLDPKYPMARLYLATAYMSQYIPGADSPDNLRNAQAAHEEFLRVLDQDPKNDVAIASIASLYLYQKKWDEAEQWYRKLIEANPQNKEAYYSLGFIAWSRFYPALGTARAKLSMRPEDPGPIKDKRVKEELRGKYLTIVDAGLQNLHKALELDPEYDDAMAYTNLLTRERADLLDSGDEYRKQIQIADGWVQKALATRKAKTDRKASASAGAIVIEPKK